MKLCKEGLKFRGERPLTEVSTMSVEVVHYG